MTRQYGNDRDPAGNWIAGRDRKLILDRVASYLTSAEWKMLKLFYGIEYDPPDATFQVIEGGAAQESDAKRWDRIHRAIKANDKLIKILPDLTGRLKIPTTFEEAGIIKCEVPGHGYSVIEGVPCKGCDCRLNFEGRQRWYLEYCSNACKQRAYRRRKKLLG